MASGYTIISVEWGNEVMVSLRLTSDAWAKVKAGLPLEKRGKGYMYDGEFFQDFWSFGGGLEGSLTVMYGEGGGVGFEGRLCDAQIEEHAMRRERD